MRLQKMADEAFYEGSIAKKIIQAMSENDGYMSAKDLREYQPRFSEPIKTTYRGLTVFAHPPPAGGASGIA